MWDDAEEDSWPDEEDWPENEGESLTISCPQCGSEVYEEADSCPHCGYFLEETPAHAMRGKPLWFVALGILGILATLLALFGGF